MTAWVYRFASWAAFIGGLILSAMVLMVVSSIVGRVFSFAGLGPVPGDFEMVEVGTAVAIFLFLPWCHVKAGHATVDLLFMHMPKWAQRVIVVASEVLMLLVWLLMTWQLTQGMLDKKQFAETTFILHMPLWWGYSLCAVGGILGCLTYAARTLEAFGWARAPAEFASTPMGEGH